jgi:hypothetical protein
MATQAGMIDECRFRYLVSPLLVLTPALAVSLRHPPHRAGLVDASPRLFVMVFALSPSNRVPFLASVLFHEM